MNMQEKYLNYELLGSSIKRPDAEEYIINVLYKNDFNEYETLFTEKTFITGTAKAMKYGNRYKNAVLNIEKFTFSKAFARIASGKYEKGCEYPENIGSKNVKNSISEKNSIDDPKIQQNILIALQNIRKADPNDYTQIPLNVDGFCHLLEILKEKYLYNASILSDKRMIEENTVLGKSKNEGYIYITTNGIDHLESINNELKINKQKSEKENIMNSDLQVDEHITQLNDLLNNLEIESESEFLKEAIDCYKVDAYRATIVLVWILTIDHLYEYVLKHKLTDFNSKLNDIQYKRFKGLVIKVKDDFCDIPEKKFIEICRSANIISKESKKILLKELDTRNSYAHPSGTKITQTITKAFIENLIHNIILKYKI